MLWVLVFLGLAMAVMIRHRALHERLKRRSLHILPVHANDDSVIRVKDQHVTQAYKKRILRA